jgi:hypothetical protein
MIKPAGKYKKAYNLGKADFHTGKPLEPNPWNNQPDKSISSWWATGWMHAKNRKESK